MFTKINGENGKTYIYDDKNRKTELLSNDAKAIDNAILINNQEYIEEIIKRLVKENLYSNWVSIICFVLRLIFLNIINFGIIGLISITEPINIISLIPIVISISTFTCTVILVKELIKNKSKRDNNTFAINYLVNELLKLKNKQKELKASPTYALIRDGQEFTIKDDEQFRNSINFMCSYFNNRNILNNSLKKSQNIREDLEECLKKPLSSYNFNPQDKQKITEDIYNSILLSKQIHSSKKRIRKK